MLAKIQKYLNFIRIYFQDYIFVGLYVFVFMICIHIDCLHEFAREQFV